MGIFSILQGTIVNAMAIAVGAFVGILLPKIPEHFRTTVMQAIGLAVLVIGFDMALATTNAVVLIISVVTGGLIGEALRLEYRLDKFGAFVEKMILGNGKKDKNNLSLQQSDGKIAKAFIFATLLYCVGSMAIVGSLDSGLLHNHDVLYTKSLLDGFSAIIFGSTMGLGVILSAVPVFIYQGAIALSASLLVDVLNDAVINEIRAVGGLLIIGIGLNLLEIKRINVVNLLPAIFIAGIIMILL